MTRARRLSKVLILSSEPFAAALVGALLKLDDLEPAFAQPGESPEDAMLRVRPILAVLVDVVLDVAQSDLFLARAKRANAQVVLFAGRSDAAALRPWAQHRDIPLFALPADEERLRALLRAVAEAKSRPREPRGADRRRPSAKREADGSFVLYDTAGRRWSVVDRRGADRRAPWA